MTHPLYDPSELTDDQILTKLGKCYSYIAQQEALGHDPTVESIKKTILALEGERTDRFDRSMREDASKTNATILDPITLGVLDTDEQDKEE